MSAAAAERERFVVQLAREIGDGDVVNAASPMTASAALLARDVHGRGAVVLHHGIVEPEPTPFRSPAAAGHGEPRGTGAYGQADALQWLDAGRIDVMFVAPAEIDGAGDMNLSRVGARRLPGGVGAADIVGLARRVVAYRTGGLARSTVRQVRHRTATAAENAGGRRGVAALVVPGASFAWERPGIKPRLASLAADREVDELGDEVGFDFDPGEPAVIPEPTAAELDYLRRLDPDGVGDLEFGPARREALARLGLVREAA
ncbi:MAG TPA: CoA-transferase [Solirubrobacterales bacterium]|nr:CoA-transferase [Solirubrobacterales bacterium]